jgi:hypothetical protein
MQSENRFLDDLAEVATGAIGTLQGLKAEIEALARQQVERLLADMDLVHRDEFEAVQAMARLAREENERLAAELAELKAALAGLSPPPTGEE